MNKNNIAGRFMFISLVGVIGVIIRMTAPYLGISDEHAVFAAIPTTMVAAWYASQYLIDEPFAAAVGMLAKMVYAPFAIWLLCKIAYYGEYSNSTLMLMVAATGVSAYLGSNREIDAHGVIVKLQTFAAASVAMVCQIILMDVLLSNATPNPLAIVSVALLVPAFFVARYGWPQVNQPTQ